MEKGFCNYVLRNIHFTFRNAIAKGIKAVPFRASTERAPTKTKKLSLVVKKEEI